MFADFSDAALTRVIEENLCAWFRMLDRWPRASVRDEGDHISTLSEVRFPVFNSVLRAQLDGGNLDARVARILESYKAFKVPAMWWITPATQPADLASTLERHGLVPGDHATGMAVDLETLPDSVPLPAGARIELATDLRMVSAFARTTAVGFGMPAFTVDDVEDLMVFGGLGDNKPWEHFVGWLDDRPVATSYLYVDDGVAGIYWVATLEAARGQGFGAALTLAACHAARARGYRIAILHATPMGRPMYERLGFRTICTLRQYLWLPAQTA